VVKWIICLLWVNQPGQLSLPSLRGRWMSSYPYNYMDYGGGNHWTTFQGCIWLVGHRSVCGRRLNLPPIGCTSALCDCDMNSAVAVCGLWHYTSVICFCLWVKNVSKCRYWIIWAVFCVIVGGSATQCKWSDGGSGDWWQRWTAACRDPSGSPRGCVLQGSGWKVGSSNSGCQQGPYNFMLRIWTIAVAAKK